MRIALLCPNVSSNFSPAVRLDAGVKERARFVAGQSSPHRSAEALEELRRHGLVH